MKRKVFFNLSFLGLFLLVVASVPKNTIEPLRNGVVCFLSSLWSRESPSLAIEEVSSSHEKQRLLVENQLLRVQLEGIREWLFCEQRLEEKVDQWKLVSSGSGEKEREFLLRRKAALGAILDGEIQSFPAKIIFRDPASWSSSLWLNIGERDNKSVGRVVVAQDSPVVTPEGLVGVVEFVGENRSRVRLITDSGCSPAVRVVRGFSPDGSLAKTMRVLIHLLHGREDLFFSSQEREEFLSILTHICSNLSQEPREEFLAKGELSGSSHPIWRSKEPILQGVGFNYDYADKEGPARDLRTGKPVTEKGEAKELIKEGDWLVTSGLDGIFPLGIPVATVWKVEELNEDGFAYNIQAKPLVTNLNNLSTVFVLPPISN